MDGKLHTVLIVLMFAGMGLIGTFSFESEVVSAGTWYFVGGTGPGNYTQITYAIENATGGDVVFVYNGTYNEHVDITKPITLTGEDRDATIINGGGTGFVVRLFSSGIDITGFTIIGSGSTNLDAGIKIQFSDSCHVYNNKLYSNPYYDILIQSGTNNLVEKNTVYDSAYGICCWASEWNTIKLNTAYGNWRGISIWEAKNNTVVNNTVRDNMLGIQLYHSYDNLLYHNKLYENMGNADDDTGKNLWNASYPIGGNFWQSHSTYDTKCGENQDLPGGDSICDTPYPIVDAGAQDNYPLTSMTCPGAYVDVPSQPPNIDATYGNNSVLLNWLKPEFYNGYDIEKYKIYRGKSPEDMSLFITINDDFSYNDTTVINGQTYYYKVSAENLIGEGDTSSVVNATPRNIPSVPRNLNVSAGDRYIDLTWEPPADAGGFPIKDYKIYKGTKSGRLKMLGRVGNVTNFTDNDVENEQTYYYQISATNSVGEGPLTHEINATPRVTDVSDEIEITNETDTDKDGLPDLWETEHGLDPDDPSDALLDPDSDGLSNLQEYQLGTDPNNPDSDNDGVPDGEDIYPLDSSAGKPVNYFWRSILLNLLIFVAVVVAAVLAFMFISKKQMSAGPPTAEASAQESSATNDCSFCGAIVPPGSTQCPECDTPVPKEEEQTEQKDTDVGEGVGDKSTVVTEETKTPPKPKLSNEEKINRLKKAYEEGKISKEVYEKNMRKFRGG